MHGPGLRFIRRIPFESAGLSATLDSFMDIQNMLTQTAIQKFGSEGKCGWTKALAEAASAQYDQNKL